MSAGADPGALATARSPAGWCPSISAARQGGRTRVHRDEADLRRVGGVGRGTEAHVPQYRRARRVNRRRGLRGATVRLPSVDCWPSQAASATFSRRRRHLTTSSPPPIPSPERSSSRRRNAGLGDRGVRLHPDRVRPHRGRLVATLVAAHADGGLVRQDSGLARRAKVAALSSSPTRRPPSNPAHRGRQVAVAARSPCSTYNEG
jgi:hypothetical protein